MKGGRIAAFKKNVERLTFAMQMFCLDPVLDNFLEIVKCESIRRDEESFDIWKLGCLYKYGAEWGLQCDPDDSKKTIPRIQIAFPLHSKNICDKAVSSPSRTNAVKIIHMFFATGETIYIDLFYQLMGHELLPLESRQYLAGLYRVTKEMYQERTAELLRANSAHFDNARIDRRVADFSYFDDAVERAREEKAAAAEFNNLFAGNVSKK